MKSSAIHDEIKSYIIHSGYTLTEVVRLLNLSRSESEKMTLQNLSNKLARGSIKYSEVLEIAAAIGLTVSWNKTPKER